MRLWASRAPSVSSGWSVLPGDGGGQPSLAVDLSFSPIAYLAPEENPMGRNPGGKRHSVPPYKTLLYQLTDPDGIALTLATSLLDDEQPIPSAQITGLLQWLQAIFAFVDNRADGEKTVGSRRKARHRQSARPWIRRKSSRTKSSSLRSISSWRARAACIGRLRRARWRPPHRDRRIADRRYRRQRLAERLCRGLTTSPVDVRLFNQCRNRRRPV